MSKADARLVHNAARPSWLLLRRYNGKRGPDAVKIRRAAWQSLRNVYATSLGKQVGLAGRLAAAGVVWPTREDA